MKDIFHPLFFYVAHKKFALVKIGLFLCSSILVFMLFFRGQTHPFDFATIYISLFLSEFFLFYTYKIAANPRWHSASLLLVLFFAIISCEVLIIVFAIDNPSLFYARFVHFSIKTIGLLAAASCFLCLILSRPQTNFRYTVFSFSFIVLSFSACLTSMLHDNFSNTSGELWWVNYAWLEGGVIVIGLSSNLFTSLWHKKIQKERFQ